MVQCVPCNFCGQVLHSIIFRDSQPWIFAMKSLFILVSGKEKMGAPDRFAFSSPVDHSYNGKLLLRLMQPIILIQRAIKTQRFKSKMSPRENECALVISQQAAAALVSLFSPCTRTATTWRDDGKWKKIPTNRLLQPRKTRAKKRYNGFSTSNWDSADQRVAATQLQTILRWHTGISLHTYKVTPISQI